MPWLAWAISASWRRAPSLVWVVTADSSSAELAIWVALAPMLPIRSQGGAHDGHPAFQRAELVLAAAVWHGGQVTGGDAVGGAQGGGEGRNDLAGDQAGDEQAEEDGHRRGDQDGGDGVLGNVDALGQQDVEELPADAGHLVAGLLHAAQCLGFEFQRCGVGPVLFHKAVEGGDGRLQARILVVEGGGEPFDALGDRLDQGFPLYLQGGVGAEFVLQQHGAPQQQVPVVVHRYMPQFDHLLRREGAVLHEVVLQLIEGVDHFLVGLLRLGTVQAAHAHAATRRLKAFSNSSVSASSCSVRRTSSVTRRLSCRLCCSARSWAICCSVCAWISSVGFWR